MTIIKKVKFMTKAGERVYDITKMDKVFDFAFISKKSGLIINYPEKRYSYWTYGKNVDGGEMGHFTDIKFVDEREDESAVKNPMIQKIKAKGFPVVACFDFQDSSATIWAKSETEIVTDDYGGAFEEEGGLKSLNDLTVEGLAKLIKEGVRPDEGDEYDEIIELSFGTDEPAQVSVTPVSVTPAPVPEKGGDMFKEIDYS